MLGKKVSISDPAKIDVTYHLLLLMFFRLHKILTLCRDGRRPVVAPRVIWLMPCPTCQIALIMDVLFLSYSFSQRQQKSNTLPKVGAIDIPVTEHASYCDKN